MHPYQQIPGGGQSMYSGGRQGMVRQNFSSTMPNMGAGMGPRSENSPIHAMQPSFSQKNPSNSSQKAPPPLISSKQQDSAGRNPSSPASKNASYDRRGSSGHAPHSARGAGSHGAHASHASHASRMNSQMNSQMSYPQAGAHKQAAYSAQHHRNMQHIPPTHVHRMNPAAGDPRAAHWSSGGFSQSGGLLSMGDDLALMRASEQSSTAGRGATRMQQQSVAAGAAATSKTRHHNHQNPAPDDETGHFQVVKGGTIDCGAPFPNGRYKIVRLLGTGTYGKVVQCEDGKYNQAGVAVKLVRREPPLYRVSAKNEIAILRDLAGRHGTLKLLRDFEHQGHVCMTFELLGDHLSDYLQRMGKPFRFDQVRDIALQLLQAVSYIHSKGIIHTDLKAENILLVANSTGALSVKVVDFGSALYSQAWHPPLVGTMHYRAPEAVLQAGWSYPLDVWAIGCLVVELYTGQHLFELAHDDVHLHMMERLLGPVHPDLLRKGFANLNQYNRNLLRQDARGTVRIAPARLEGFQLVTNMRRLKDIIREPNFLHLVRLMLEYDPSKRISASKALLHPFFEVQDDNVDIVEAASDDRKPEPRVALDNRVASQPQRSRPADSGYENRAVKQQQQSQPADPYLRRAVTAATTPEQDAETPDAKPRNASAEYVGLESGGPVHPQPRPVEPTGEPANRPDWTARPEKQMEGSVEEQWGQVPVHATSVPLLPTHAASVPLPTADVPAALLQDERINSPTQDDSDEGVLSDYPMVSAPDRVAQAGVEGAEAALEGDKIRKHELAVFDRPLVDSDKPPPIQSESEHSVASTAPTTWSQGRVSNDSDYGDGNSPRDGNTTPAAAAASAAAATAAAGAAAGTAAGGGSGVAQWSAAAPPPSSALLGERMSPEAFSGGARAE
eukprot:CAMPEP_0181291424 /NCGR_PEP_ID=MMETSP1101-20121128/1959_1 /TAXON_ID=46948 /ORGANISM="Rhodomonas abbreviata, Strain Caron Lab Isolate" /LENGTH=897 /DNA_ID=CAMNT_0023395813 /DNA_START=244 /DNA_END=2938 /DNA_ORIENTATION=+